jgi:hypothetical protein
VPLPEHVLVSILRGETPLLVHEPAQTSLRWEGGHYVVDITSKNEATQRLHLEVPRDDYDRPWQEQRVRVTWLETLQRGQQLYAIELSDHELAATAPPREDPDGLAADIPPSGGPCSVEVPRSIRMTVPHSGDDVLFDYDEVKLNPPLPLRTFTQPMPGGVRAVAVDCRDEAPPSSR